MKKLSQKTKKLGNQLKYQKQKLNKLKKEFKEFLKEDKRKLIESWRRINHYKTAKKSYSGLKKGKRYKFATLRNGLISESVRINSKINKLQDKIKKTKVQRIPKGDFKIVIGKAWEHKDIENAILNNPEIESVNGVNIKRNKDEILNILNDLKLNMSYEEQLLLVYGDDMKAKLVKINEGQFNRIENKHKNKSKFKKKKK